MAAPHYPPPPYTRGSQLVCHGFGITHLSRPKGGTLVNILSSVNAEIAAISVDREVNRIQNALRHDGVVYSPAVHADDLGSAILRHKDAFIFHISCHCGEVRDVYADDKRLNLIGGDVDAAELKRHFRQPGVQVSCLVLMCCNGEDLANALLEDSSVSLNYVLCANRRIADELCIEFSDAFYNLLFLDYNVLDAFEQAHVIVGRYINGTKPDVSGCDPRTPAGELARQHSRRQEALRANLAAFRLHCRLADVTGEPAPRPTIPILNVAACDTLPAQPGSPVFSSTFRSRGAPRAAVDLPIRPRSTVVVMGSAGNGKSTFCNRLVTDDGAAERRDVFRESAGANAETLTTASHVTFWAGPGRDAVVIDTPGLSESAAADEAHLQCMMTTLTALPNGEVDAVLLCFNLNSPRFLENEKRLVRLFASLFKRGDFWDNIGLVFTMCYAAVFRDDTVLDRRRTEFVPKLREVIAGMGVVRDGPIPCFFVDSADLADPRTRAELLYLRQWVATRTPMSTLALEAPSSRFLSEKRETREREVHRTSEPKYETRTVERWDGDLGKIIGRKKTKVLTEQVGTTVKVTMVREERMKRTRYDGEISYTEWEEVGRWIVTQ